MKNFKAIDKSSLVSLQVNAHKLHDSFDTFWMVQSPDIFTYPVSVVRALRGLNFAHNHGDEAMVTSRVKSFRKLLDNLETH